MISTQVLGFSIDSVAERRGNKLLVTFIGAANCWGLRSLSQGNPLARPPLVNDFGAKVVGAWLARCGYAGSREPAATTFDAAIAPQRSEARWRAKTSGKLLGLCVPRRRARICLY